MSRGFTLIELLVTIAVAAILLGVAVPSYIQLTHGNRASADANRVLRTLALARSEAVQRNQPVVLCIVAAEKDACAQDVTTWETGFLMFADANRNGVFDSADEAIIQIERPWTSTSEIRGNTNLTNSVTFDSGGRASQLGTLTVSVKASDDFVREVTISTTGRARIKE